MAKKTEFYSIEKCRSKEDFDNHNFMPSDGGKYNAEDAIRILERGNGGAVISESGASSMVNYNPAENGWVKNKLNVK